MMNKDMKKKYFGNRTRFLAAAALTAALVVSQVPYVYANEDAGISSETSGIFPDNITVESPVALSEVDLPSNEYGTLSWADDSYVPEKRVQSCKVKLTPFKGVDLSWAEGWDAEEGVVNGKINVVVSSIESEDAEDEEDASEETDSEDTSAEGNDSAADTPEDGISDENPEISPTGTPELTPEGDKLSPVPDISEEASGTEATDESKKEDSDQKEKEEAEQTSSEESAEEPTEEKTADTQTEKDENISPETDTDITKEESVDGEESEESDNIFDNPVDFTQEDDRPTDAEESLTAQEKNERAQMNHSCDGIYVSGINLPWYVQFRVSSGEDYQFTNKSEAMIFQSYEFELWDLKNDTEYEIPDGEYISVTVPVKEGYDYTIEHLLDNGATETIIPSVDGDTMVFSTHSFSPFGIAGSKQLVGPDFGYDAVLSVTPTPTPSVSVSVTPAAGGNSTNSKGGSTGTSNGGSGNGSSTVNNGTQGSVQSGTSGNQNVSSGGSSSGNNGSQSAADDSGNNTVSDGTTNNSAVDTGDTTAILPFVILIGAAALIIIAVIVLKKKKK